ncbi:MAG: alpha/beta fold hydrolase [Acidobacteriota bacterium]
MSFEQHVIEIEGFKTRYTVAGKGQGILLLHAGGESASDWHWAISSLADTYRVYAPNLHGLSEEGFPNSQYTTNFLTRFVVQFLEKLNVQRAIIVGNSLGGLIGIDTFSI